MAPPALPVALDGSWSEPAGASSGAHAGRSRRLGTIRGHRLPVIAHVLGVVLGVGAMFGLVQSPFRRFEVVFDAGLLHLVGFTGVGVTAGHDILLNPARHAAFWVNIAPPCSSLPAVLSLVGLATIISPRVRSGNGVSSLRFARSVAVAAAVMFLGNVVRIDSSILMGLVAGRVVLVLFHDWVGSVFGFASLLAGWVLLIWMLLPTRSGRGSGWRRPGVGFRQVPGGRSASMGAPVGARVSDASGSPAWMPSASGMAGGETGEAGSQTGETGEAGSQTGETGEAGSQAGETGETGEEEDR